MLQTHFHEPHIDDHMALPHTGSWGLPDFGITEMLSGNRTAQGGSNFSNSVGNYPTAIVNNQPIQGPGLGWYGDVAKNGGQVWQDPSRPIQPNNTVPPSTSTLGAATQNTGGGARPAPNPSPAAPTWQSPDGTLWQNADAYMGTINDVYNESYNRLNQSEQQLRAGENDFYNQYTKPYDAQMPLLEQAKTTGLQQNQVQTDQARQQEESAMSAARRLYSELTQGTKQRFGGSNSAGEFAQAFLGREQQRQMGQVQQQAGQNYQNLATKAQEIQGQYQTQVQSLTMQKEAALSQAKDAFRQRLDAINNTRLGLDQNKAQLKLQALQELRQRSYQIEDQARNYQQQLASMVAQQTAGLATAVQGFQAQAGKPVDMQAIQNAVAPYFNYQNQGMQQPNAIASAVGSLSPDRRERYA